MKEDIRDLLLNNIDKTDVIADAWDLRDELDFSGGVHEIIDGSIDIYYYNLREWAVENYGYIEQALEEGFLEGVTDFHKLIQGGQYVYYTEQAQEAIEELFAEYDGKAFNVEQAA